MPGAQNAFSSICPITYGEYCGAPWQVTIDTCCGLCPSPAINAYGTVAGLCIASFFAMLIVLFQPAQSAWYIAAQLALAHMYLVAIMARNIMGTASEGTNAIQRWHAEFAFLLASSITGTIIACVLSDTHYIHGFSSADEHDAFLDASAAHAIDAAAHPGQRRYGSHPLHLQQEDEHRPGEHGRNVARAMQRFRKWAHRHQAVLLLATFAGSELYWFILCAGTVWWGSSHTTSWQSNCDTLIGTANYRVVEATSWTFVSLAFLATLFLCIPVFGRRTDSAAHAIVRALSLHRETRRTALSPRGGSGATHNTPLEGTPGPASRTNTDLSASSAGSGNAQGTRAETWVKVGLSLVVWTFWFVMVLVILLRALDQFLLVGTAWPYAAIQNLIFGFFAAIKFVLSTGREHARSAQKAYKARRAQKHSSASSPSGSGSAGSGGERARRKGRSALRRGRREPPPLEVSAPQTMEQQHGYPVVSAAAARYARVRPDDVAARRAELQRERHG
ncbi:hypothetical protein JCM10450v2_008293 [Rhodotorula kratochvilovae]